jgi:hypothetical protein
MPVTDEDLLRDLMHLATGDLHAPPAVAVGIVTASRRRYRRTRALGITMTGAAAATAIGVATATSGASAPDQPRATTPALTLTAAQQTLDHLSAAAAAAPQPTGGFVTMTELRGNEKSTTIVNTRTGDVWTLQSAPGAPRVLFSAHGMPTAAQLGAYPTSVASLRSFLLSQARQQQMQALRLMQAAIARKDKGHVSAVRVVQPKETVNDLVFAQAAYTLWNPVISPSLRSALLKVIAATPGVVVNSHARDSIGRPAVEISRFDAAARYTEAIFAAPDATRVLETSSIQPATPASSDTYLSITWSRARPAI